MHSKTHFVEALRDMATFLQEHRKGDHWSAVLTVVAALCEAQDGELSPAQRQVMRKELFGGMGSLADTLPDGTEAARLRDRLIESL